MFTRTRLIAAFASTALFIGAFACSDKDPTFTLEEQAAPAVPPTTVRVPSTIEPTPAPMTLSQMTSEIFTDRVRVAAPVQAAPEEAPVPRDVEASPAELISASAPSTSPSENTVSSDNGAGRNCGINTLTRSFAVRELRSDELPAVTFPYISTTGSEQIHPDRQRDIAVLGPGVPTSIVDEIAYVENAQVAFAMDITGLPARDAVISVESANLHLKLAKLNRGGALQDELFCFADDRLCSGVEDPEWQDNRNPLFFAAFGPINDLFSQKIVDDREPARVGDHIVHRGTLILSLEELLKDSPTGTAPLDIVYGQDSPPHHPLAMRTLRAIVGQDIFVGTESRLEITLVVDDCRAAQLAVDAAREAALAAEMAPPPEAPMVEYPQ